MREINYIHEHVVYMQRYSQHLKGVHKRTYVEGLAEFRAWSWVRTISELEKTVGEVKGGELKARHKTKKKR